MLTTLVLAALQQAAPTNPALSVTITPAPAEVAVGDSVRLQAAVRDAQGATVSGARVRWFSSGNEGSVDSSGVVVGGYVGQVRVTAVASVPGSRPAVAHADVRIVPQAAARIEFAPRPARLLVGSRLTLVGTAFSPQGDPRSDAVRFSSSAPAVLRVTEDGRLTALAPGRAVVTARAGRATATQTIAVVASTVTRLGVEPGTASVRTGDVVRFRAVARDASGAVVPETVARWAVAGGEGVAQIGTDGAFVAEMPGTYTVTAEVGPRSAEALVRVEPRGVGRGFEVVGRVPIDFSSAEVWVHPSGTCAYLSTIADRVYAIDVSTPASPRIVDSMVADARLINDVMTTEDGRYGVFTRESASNRQNGIVIFDASDPCHPTPISEYTETVSGGVHSSYVYQGRVYLTDDATGSLRVIDIRDPYRPREVARWQTEQTERGRYIHDVAVTDGLAYLSYWNDGLVILDVGNGVKGGSPERPVLVSQYKYDLDALYRRVDQLWGLGARGTHTAWRHRDYVFIGDEVYAERSATGLQDGNNLTFGRLQVLDVSDLAAPRLVAWYEPTDGGVHNIWVEGDTLYLGNYQGGARALDISGELKGDLLRQGREMSWILTADDRGHRPRATFAWGAVVKNGIIYVPDINTGLWMLRLEPKGSPTP